MTDYAQLAGAPTGNGWELFAAVTAIYAVCLLAPAGGADGARKAVGDGPVPPPVPPPPAQPQRAHGRLRGGRGLVLAVIAGQPHSGSGMPA